MPRMFMLTSLAAVAAAAAARAEPVLEMQQLFPGDRFPNVVVAVDGSVLAFWNGVVVRRSEDGGETWSDPIRVGDGFMGGGVTVDERSGDILAFVESGHPPADLTVYRSTDHGRTWAAQDTTVHPDPHGHVPSMHMNEHGITLHTGPHAGRLLRPSRWYGEDNGREHWPTHYTNAIYSDDGGRTWHTSAPFRRRAPEKRRWCNLRTGRCTTTRVATGRRTG